VWTSPNPAAGGQGQPATKMQAGKFYVGANGAVTGAAGSKPSSTASKGAPAGSGPAGSGPMKNSGANGGKPASAPDKSAQLRNSKPTQPGSESAKLNTSPALPGKASQVKSQ
jgi:hypothetical protein